MGIRKVFWVLWYILTVWVVIYFISNGWVNVGNGVESHLNCKYHRMSYKVSNFDDTLLFFLYYIT